MKKLLILFLFTLSFNWPSFAQECSECGRVVISSAIDGRTADRRGLEVCVIDDVTDMSIYSVTVDSGTLSDTDYIDGDFQFPAGPANAGDCFWIAYDAPSWETFMGLPAGSVDFEEGLANLLNGDRNIYITCLGNVDDIYGVYLDEIPQDDPAFWEDSWIVSNNDRCPNGGVLDVANWTVGAVDATDNKDFANETGFPFNNFTHASGSACTETKTCGGVHFCDFIQYACVVEENGVDDFTATIIYEGFEPGTVINTLENYDGDLIVDPSSSDPATDANGTLVMWIDGTIGSPWGIEIISPNCDGIQIWDRIPENCEDIVTGCPITAAISASCELDDAGDPTGNLEINLTVNGSDDYTITGDLSTAGLSVIAASTFVDGSIDITVTDNLDNTCSTTDMEALPDCSNDNGGGNGGINASIATLQDPCGCNDSNNIDSDGNGVVDLFYETVTITSDSGENWTMNNTSTGVVDASGMATSPLFMESPAGTYTAVFYHSFGTGYNASFTDGTDTLSAANSCTNCAEGDEALSAVPTMSEWGLIILSLLILNFIVLNVAVASIQTENGARTQIHLFNSKQLNSYPFNQAIFKQAALLTAILVAIITAVTFSMYGYIAMIDIVGTAIAAPLFAYLIHLLVITNISEETH